MRALALLLLLAAPALAGEDGPVCGRPGVLRLVAETLQRAGEKAVLEQATAGQIPGNRPGLVRCAVRVHTRLYDTNRAGFVPLERVSIYEYSLELRRNGIFLRPPP